jgi:hypothetical protein
VKLHEETLKALLEAGVDALPQPETIRSKLGHKFVRCPPKH